MANLAGETLMARVTKLLRERLWGIFVVLSIVGPLALSLLYVGLAHRVDDKAAQAYVNTCQSGNEVRHEVIGLVNQLTINSQRNAQAVIASPTATAEQKHVAQQNLASIQHVNEVALSNLELRDCTYPPKTR